MNLEQGCHYWRRCNARRLRLLVDGAEYFEAVYRAVQRARHSVLILGWDIDSEVRLLRGDDAVEEPVRLGAFLDHCVRQRPELCMHVLVWDFAMIYALEREVLPVYKLQWRTHKRMRFHMDDRHPVGASHHQKVVVVDDRLAFVGGLDLTRCRWDTPEHRPDDPRREDNGERYPPFHDLQWLVEGEAAAALGDLARERWHRATGHELSPPPESDHPLWPEALKADFEDTPVLLSRTEPAHDGDPETREIEHQLLAAIAAAERFIYIENQYLTSAVIGQALAARLEESTGPEIVIVLPGASSGWLEQATMDVLRARVLTRLQQADRHGRLRVYYPHIPGLGEAGLMVHGKLLCVDDTLLCVGSANLSNRSMGFDTECSLSVVAADDATRRTAIAAVRNRLLAEHLDVAPARVGQAVGDGLVAGIEHLCTPTGRSLRPLDWHVSETLDRTVPDAALIDPERPIRPEVLVEQFMPELDDSGSDADTPPEKRGRPRWRHGLVALGALLLLAALWHWTPLGEWLDRDQLTTWIGGFRDSWLGPPVALAVFLIASVVAFPITVLIVVNAAVFGPLQGLIQALIGCLGGAALGYALGYWLGRGSVRQLTGSRINRLSRRMARHGMLTVALIRNLPVAPFTVVNLVAGASRIRLRDYLLGTLLGMAPGILTLTVFADGVLRVLRNPEPSTVFTAIAAIAVVGGLAWALQRWLRRQQADRAARELS